MKRMLVLLAGILSAGPTGCLSGSGCSDDAVPGPDGAVDVDGPNIGDARPDVLQWDAQPDVGLPDAGPGSDCTISTLPPEEILPQELYRLPQNPGDDMSSVSWNGRHVAYATGRCGAEDPRKADIYLFDLARMEESVVTEKPGGQFQVSVAADSLVYTDYSYSEVPGWEYRNELFWHDIATGQERRLTDSNWAKYEPKYNGSQVAYESWEWNPEDPSGPADLVLRDVATGQETLLADHTQNVQGYDISEDYVVWQAVPQDEPGVWDIFYHHISSGVTSRLHRSTKYLLWASVSGNRVVWNEQVEGNWDVFVQDLTTGLEERLTNEEHDQIEMWIHGHLVVWFDYRDSGDAFPSSSYDLYLHDLETGVTRRLTAQSGHFGALQPSCQWFIYTQAYSRYQYVIYAWDLVLAGVLDENCHVIPCDPANEQCSTIQWRVP